MKQQPQSIDRLIKRRNQRAGSPASSEQHCSILKSELFALTDSFTSRITRTQQTLRSTLQQNRLLKIQISARGEQLLSMGQQLQRLRLILPIKEQLIGDCHSELTGLRSRVQQLEQSASVQRPFSKLSLPGLQEMSPIECQSLSGSNPTEAAALGETKRKICLRKEKPRANHAGQLQVARLRSEVGRLRAENRELAARMEMLRIEKEHWEMECGVVEGRERHLSGWVKGRAAGSEKNLREKREQLEKYIDRLAERAQRAERQSGGGCALARKSEGLHPPTPHFSGAGLGFGRRQKHLSAPNGVFPLQEQVSLGEIKAN